MSTELLCALVIASFAVAISGIFVGVHLVRTAFKKKIDDKVNAKYLIIGWSLIGTLSLALTVATIYLISLVQSIVMVVATIFSPVLFLIAFVLTLSLGGTSLREGIKSKSRGKIIGGAISLTICTAVVITAIVLFIMLLYALSHIHIGAM